MSVEGQNLQGALQTNGKYPQAPNSSAAPRAHWPVVYRPSVANAHRKQRRKWMMPKYMYPEQVYPPFLAGAGYVARRAAVDCIFNASKVL